MAQMVETASGPAPLAQWIGRRPAVLILWASWCAPCLVEKRYQAALAQRLVTEGAWTRLFALQAYDTALNFDDGRRMLDRLGAASLPNARLMPGAEQAFQRLFNTTTDRTAQILPSTMLVGGDGLELGRSIGLMTGPDGATDYWQDEATFDFLRQLV
jgi:thiol-disulfide isomerase/thioredoxin